jgi:hypothetical protein
VKHVHARKTGPDDGDVDLGRVVLRHVGGA